MTDTPNQSSNGDVPGHNNANVNSNTNVDGAVKKQKKKKFFLKKNKNKRPIFDVEQDDGGESYLSQDTSVSAEESTVEIKFKLDDEYESRVSTYTKNQVFIDSICNTMRAKTGVSQNILEKQLNSFFSCCSESDFISPTNTNLFGFAILYNSTQTLEYIKNNNKQFSWPKILGKESLAATFSQSVQTNTLVFELLEGQDPQKLEDTIIQNLKHDAPINLYKLENIDFYVSWLERKLVFKPHLMQDVKECLMNCLLKNNRPFLLYVSAKGYLKSILGQVCDDFKQQYPKKDILWLELALRKSISVSKISTSTDLPHSTAASDVYLSDKKEKLKSINQAIFSANPVNTSTQIVTKPRRLKISPTQ